MLGLTGYYHKYVPVYADLVWLQTQPTNNPFYKVCSMPKSFWDAFMKDPILVNPDQNKLYNLSPYASECTWSAVLTQEDTSDTNGKIIKHHITYISGLFQGSQVNWAALTTEACAIYMAVKN